VSIINIIAWTIFDALALILGLIRGKLSHVKG
jgi:hypothetical protein